ncbi:MAG: lipoprotein insertase outer membrane protein LolB [Beggiatoa sp.]|jgi:outer membrane lipoprotein LolB|nr:lipoprotein insertase outer membrane protein LolB [Beggiatoa sp.]
MRSSALGLALLAAGCATSAPPPGEPLTGAGSDALWTMHRERVAKVQDWYLAGRVALATPEEGWNAALYWTQTEERYSLRVVAPLGQGSYGLEGGPNQVVMRTPDRRTLTAEDPESLILAQLGWTLPVFGLRYWVRGIPEPLAPVAAMTVDDRGRMTELEQSGWRINVLGYEARDGLDLPSKLFLQTDRFKVRIVVERWTSG